MVQLYLYICILNIAEKHTVVNDIISNKVMLITVYFVFLSINICRDIFAKSDKVTNIRIKYILKKIQ